MSRRRDRKETTNKSPLATHDVSTLVGPIIGFLHKSGIGKNEILKECRSALNKAGSKSFKLPVTHFEFGKDAIEIVNRWLRDPKYLNRNGRPDELPLAGVRSVTSLVKDCRVKVSADSALKLLLTFKIATRVASKKYRLVRRSMEFSNADHLPFEPNFRFLVDATRSVTNRLQRPKDSHKLLWHCADNLRIHPRATQEFLNFVAQRGLLFMQEINDWLEEHELRDPVPTRRRQIRTKRLGVGLFPIASDS